MQRKWNIAHPPPVYSPPPPPTLTTTANPANTQEYARQQRENRQTLAEYNRKRAEYTAQYVQQIMAFRANRPWLVGYADEIVGYTSTAAAIWILWAVMRAIGARRHVPPVIRPPICEACGYNLTTLPMEARCPECGEPVESSLGPANRPGAAWQQRRTTGRLRAWWRSSVDAARRPSFFGRRLQVSSRTLDHRLFLVGHLIPVFLIAAPQLPAVYCIDTDRNPFEDPQIVYTFVLAIGVSIAAASLFFVVLAAGLVGLWLSVFSRRNLLRAAMQCAAYLAGFLTLCCLLPAMIGLFMNLEYEGRWSWFHSLAANLGFSSASFRFSGWWAPSVAMLLVYLVLLYKGTRAARYANR